MSARSVAIIGGGIGGLTTANTLKKIGMSVSLYERAPFFIPTAGAGFGFQPNGQAVLSQMGFEKEVRNIIHPYYSWMMIDKKGNIISRSEKLKSIGDRLGYFVGGAVRADLVDILVAPLQNTGIVHYSHNVTNIEQDKEGVTLQFEKQQPVKVDIVIGADGIHSIVVDKIFPRTVPPVFSGENIFYGVMDDISKHSFKSPLIGIPNTLIQGFSQGEFIMFPVGNRGQFVWAATYSATGPPPQGDVEWTISSSHKELHHILERYPKSHPIHECVENTSKDRTLHFGMYYRQHSKEWHRGRVCLLGDACHATLPYVGQGANMSIEDGLVLSMCLEKNNFNHEIAFSDFYQKRFDRTKRVTDMSRNLGLFLHSENIFASALRRVLLPRLMRSNMFLRMAEEEFYKNCPINVEKKV